MTKFKKGDYVFTTNDETGVVSGIRKDTTYVQVVDSNNAVFYDDAGDRRERPGGYYTVGRPGTTTTEDQLAERDPNGVDAHSPGAKLDAGKVRPSLIVEGMARAIWGVAEVATFGAAKYTPGGWVLVPNGQERYADAGYRHLLKRAMGEDKDPDSELEHLKHEAWNALAKLDLYLREQEKGAE